MIFQCYFNDHTKERCTNKATKELEYWCSKEHEKDWKAFNYPGKHLSIKEMQEKLLEMGKGISL